MQYGLTDRPDPRKQHNIPLVRLGGIAMILGFALAIATILIINGSELIPNVNNELILITLVGSTCCFLIGLADDLLALSPWPRLVLQVIVACAVWSQGIQIGAINLDWLSNSQSLVFPQYISLIATLIWLVGVTNAINWLDGLDGLAAGVTGIAAIGLFLLSFSLNQIEAAFLAAALIGCSIGFLRHNLNPARILMGDGGSYFLGFCLASISIISCYSITEVTGNSTMSVSLHLPMLILAVPISDMTAVIILRVREGLSPFYPDRRHLHHRLLRSGLTHRQTVLFIYGLSQWLVSIALFAANTELRLIWLALSSLILMTTIITCTPKKH